MQLVEIAAASIWPPQSLGWFLLAALASGFGGYFGSYLKKKGENLATHEDLDRLVKQMEATTNATKAIEARISNEVWNRQRQWELKRDALLEGGRALADLNTALMKLNAVYSAKSSSKQMGSAFATQEEVAIDAFNKASYSFQRAQLVVSVVSGNELQKAFIAMETILKEISLEVVSGDTEKYSVALPKIKASATGVIQAIQAELDIEIKGRATPRSNESSAAPSPGSQGPAIDAQARR
jgi:hypothetical protein